MLSRFPEIPEKLFIICSSKLISLCLLTKAAKASMIKSILKNGIRFLGERILIVESLSIVSFLIGKSFLKSTPVRINSSLFFS